MQKFKVILLLMIIGGSSYAQIGLQANSTVRNNQRVNYIYNFTDYITWSNLSNYRTFKIGVYGENNEELVAEFEKVALKKKIKNLPVQIVKVTSLKDILELQILYIHKKSAVEMGAILPKLMKKEVLLVSENYSFRESMINFMEFENEFHFDVNEQHINDGGLLVSPQLITFSIQQQKDWQEIFEQLEADQEKIVSQRNALDLLNKEILAQKSRLDAQRAQIKKQQINLNSQEGDIAARKQELSDKLAQINRQTNELSKLQEKVRAQNVQTFRLTNTLDRQKDSIRVRSRELVSKYHKIVEQEQRILNQKEAINQQENKLDNQLEKLRSQGLLIYVFLAVFIVVLGLIFFAWREYKRKKKSEQEVKVQNEKLLALNESLDSFVYRVSHDLKAPVINVKNMIGMLKEHTNEEEASLVPKIIENLELSSDRLDMTITDLLAMSKIEKVDEIRSQIQVKDVFHTIWPEFQVELDSIGAKVKLSFKDSGTFSSFAEMSSVLQNLLTNSIKYRRKDVPLVISVSTSDNNDETLIVYSDNGSGIDLNKFEGKLFSMFQRFTSDQSIAGTGVGMYIIKRLVDKNNGSVKLVSEPNKGLKYLITLPSKMPKQ